MDLKTCPKCAYQVTDDAALCPRCGLANPAKEAALKPQGLKATIIGICLCILLGSMFIGGIFAAVEEAWNRPSCWNDYRKCADNAQLVMFHRLKDLTSLPSTCQATAESLSRYGKPDLPWGAFRQAPPGDWSIKSGFIELVEREARFPNMYGAMEKRVARCHIDLQLEHVTFKLDR